MIYSKKRRAAILALAILSGTLVATGSQAAQAPATPAPAQANSTVIKLGATGIGVVAVQYRLKQFGYTIVVDGIFGQQTHRAVVHFQTANRITADGIVGPITIARLWPNGSNSGASPAPAPAPGGGCAGPWSSLPCTPIPAAVAGCNVSLPQPGCGGRAPAPSGRIGSYQHPNPNVERWHATALRVGWTEAEWRWLSCTIHRESRGNFDSVYKNQYYGLMQIAWPIHRTRVTNMGGSLARLFEGDFNLAVALQMYREGQRHRPWGTACL